MKTIIFIVVTCLSVCGGYATSRVFDKSHIIAGKYKNG